MPVTAPAGNLVLVDTFDRWANLYEKGMYQLARLEIRTVAERDRMNAAASFALGLTELALGNHSKALRSFLKCSAVVQSRGGPAPPPGFERIGDVVQRVLRTTELRGITAPLTPFWWLQDPSRVGSEEPPTPGTARLLLRMQPLEFRSPLDPNGFHELERRASTFSYDVFQLDKMRGVQSSAERAAPRTPAPTREERKARHEDNKRARETERLIRQEVRRDRQQNAAAPRAPQQRGEEPRPAPGSAEWKIPPAVPVAAAPAVAAAATVRTEWTPPPPARPTPSAAPPPLAPRVLEDPADIALPFERPRHSNSAEGDPWIEWEATVYDLADQHRLSDALEKVRQALHRHPDSSRIREHEARILGRMRRNEEAIASWMETYRRSVQSGAADRAERAAREALALNWRDTPRLLAVASEIASYNNPTVAGAVLKIAVERLAASGRLDAVADVVKLMGRLSREQGRHHALIQQVLGAARAVARTAADVEAAYREGRGGG
ncbi:MAG: hypothetical protein SF028_04550 [Candidatus Sumerlaeia bacterium]|nr:hypothetical protein [Candidatus Sumerlaeia bacterium]